MPEKTKCRVIIDTNIWISFLLTNDQSKLDHLFSQQHITILFNEELLEEFKSVAQRQKFRKYFSSVVFDNLILRLQKKAIFIRPKSVVTICRDSKDDFLLALAADGGATHLITGDKDLLVLTRFKKTDIVTMTEFYLIGSK